MRILPCLIFVTLGFQILTGCDSASFVKDPNESFFLKLYGGDGDQTGDDVVVLPDGSFVLFGTTRPTGKNSQWYLVKADAKGIVLWEKTFGGPSDEEARDIELTNDNRLVVVGNRYKSLSPVDRDVCIMTLTLDGVKIDSAIIALKKGAAETDEDAHSVSLTSDGFMVAGSTTSTPIAATNDQLDGMHLRFYNNLLIYPVSWGKTNGQGAFDVIVKVVEVVPTVASPGQFYAFGYSNSSAALHPTTDFNYWIFELGITGVSTNNRYIGSVNDDERLSSVAISPTQSIEGYFLGGITYNPALASDFYVSKLRKSFSNNATDFQFDKPLSVKLGNNLPERTSVFASQFGGFYIMGNENNLNNNQNWILTKINIDGSIAWSLPIVFGGEGIDTCGAIQELPDGRIVLIGTMRTGKPDAGEMKMTLLKVSQDGKLSN